jgi:hypothetical protein
MRLERHEIKSIVERIEKHPFFLKEAEGVTVKITLLNLPFIEYFGGGPTVLNTWMCNDIEWRILFFNSNDPKMDSKVNQKFYVELIEGLTHDMDSWIRLHDFIHDHWNPGGIYALEKFVFERV